jgi:ribulose-5-phosphate 4-epimerase/fuculose-1-phosphate aldolase
MFHISAFLSPRVPVFEIRKVAGMTDMLVSNAQIGKALAEALGPSSVVLMRGHGMAVVGPALPLTVFRAIYTEVNARLQTQAIEIGGPITFLVPEEAEKANKLLDQVHLRAWDLWKREETAKAGQ